MKYWKEKFAQSEANSPFKQKNEKKSGRKTTVGGKIHSAKMTTGDVLTSPKPWTKFKNLPKDVIIVYAFMKGCKLPYLKGLKESGWFNRKQDKWEEREKKGWRTFYHMGKFLQKPPDFKLKNEKPRK